MPRFPQLLIFAALLAGVQLLAGCTEVVVGSHLVKKTINDGCVENGDNKVGKPYIVDGKQYVPITSSLNYREQGTASWYGTDFHGKATANGECYNMYSFTAAHKTLPLPTIVRVTNLANNKSIIVKVNDRGPFVGTRLIDLSYAAAQSLDIARRGTAPVLVEAIGGPHNYPNGLADYLALQQSGGLTNDQAKLGPATTTLPSIVPETAHEEDLSPLARTTPPPPPAAAGTSNPTSFTNRAVAAAQNKPVTDDGTAPAFSKPSSADAGSPDVSPPATQAADVAAAASGPQIQLGAFSDQTRANAVLTSVRSTDPTAHLSPLKNANGSTLWRVRTGPYNSAADAQSALARLQRAGFNQAQLKTE